MVSNVQAHNNTLRRTAATATRPRAQAHDNTLRCTVATTTRTGATKTTKSSTKPCIHVASHGGDNDNNYGDDDDECRRRGLVRKRMAFSYCVARRQRQQGLVRKHTTTHRVAPRQRRHIVRERTISSYHIASCESDDNNNNQRQRTTSVEQQCLVPERTTY